MQFFPPRLILESSLRNLRAPRAHILIQRNTHAGRCLLHAVITAHKAKRIGTQLRKNTGHLHNKEFLSALNRERLYLFEWKQIFAVQDNSQPADRASPLGTV